MSNNVSNYVSAWKRRRPTREKQLQLADALAKAAEIISMYARINHDKPKDYGEIIDPALMAYKKVRGLK